jgi:exodeoxyribonuclease VII large subunit
MHELSRGGYAFRVAHADVRVQGAGAWRRIAYALRKVAATNVDVIVLVRGGGSRSDLAPFDAEGVARAITEMPVPVLTGIGHEVDRTVADAVAHTSAKTPTAIAALLVDAIDEYCDDLARLAHRVSLRARGACAVAERELAEVARRVQRSVPVVLAAEATRIDHQELRLHEGARRGTRDAALALDGVEARVKALDPRRVLERGYTITRTVDGTIVRAAAAVSSGDVVVTETGDGSVQSRVEGVSDTPASSEAMGSSDARGEDDT